MWFNPALDVFSSLLRSQKFGVDLTVEVHTWQALPRVDILYFRIEGLNLLQRDLESPWGLRVVTDSTCPFTSDFN